MPALAVAGADQALGNTLGSTTVNSGGTLAFRDPVVSGITYSTGRSRQPETETGAAGRAGAMDNVSGANSFAVADHAAVGFDHRRLRRDADPDRRHRERRPLT